MLAIFGPESKEIISSGDAVQDKAVVDAFVAAYGVMHRWRKMPDGAQILLVGADNFPFPIPLKKNASGQWFFDTAAGKDEILARRIGRNELAVIDVCGALADAQAEYFSQRHDGGSTKQYALKFISDTGKQNGLYWESPEGQPKSPLGPLVAFATDEGYSAKADAHTPFHGYYFRMLKKQGSHAPGGAKDYVVDGKMVGGFAFVAYPAEYGNSGVMTFIINQDGVLLQKDLGKTTTETATAMSEFDPDTTWSPGRANNREQYSWEEIYVWKAHTQLHAIDCLLLLSVRCAPVSKPSRGSCFHDYAGRKLDYVLCEGVGGHRGYFRQVGRHFDLYVSDVTTGVLDIKIHADSVNTGSGMKDGKLKSKDFFNVEEDPLITFHQRRLCRPVPPPLRYTATLRYAV